MPCWYYDKKELRNTPSARDGIDYATEARYRKEGARFIIDCGTKLGLRYDSCATGVVFFHRFYMFHSFKEFHRYVTAACCLFLAGKTEETPKKCKDLIKTTRSMLTDAQFAVFGEDPKEEIMTLERILLQTIKFDLMVEHPYAYLLKFAKLIKADKAKVQKLVQMAWTFINDSMCTTLCLQWEPEVIAVSLMYLATRLNKTEITDWIGKPPGFKGKWWESLVEDVNQELLEDVCHQVLDLYQPSHPVKSGSDETSPQTSGRTSTGSTTASTATKRPRSPPPSDSTKCRVPTPSKAARDEKHPSSPTHSSSKEHDRSVKPLHSTLPASSTKTSHQSTTNSGPSTPGTAPVVPTTTTGSGYSQNNPYMSQHMYSSSFMSQEGSQSIQSLVGGRTSYTGATSYTQPPPAQPPPASIPVPPTTSAYSQPPTYQQSGYQATSGYQQPPPQPPSYQQPPPAVSRYSQPNTYTQSYTYPPPAQPVYSSNSHYQTPPPPSYNQNYTGQYAAGQQYPASYPYNSQSYQNFAHSQTYPQPQTAQPPPPGMPPHIPPPRPATGLPSVRITGRPS